MKRRGIEAPLLSAAFVLLLAASTNSAAATRTVCASGCSFTTIQSAIDNAVTVTGDVIQVANGTYSENINYHGKNITIQSQNGAAVTKIQGTGTNAPVVTFGSGETGAVLDGFTIDNQAAANSSSRGISITGSAAPMLKNIIVVGNNTITSWVPGSGIYINGGGATIQDSTIGGDAANKNTCQNGCGIYATAMTAPLSITNTTFSENAGVLGSGIYLLNNGAQTTTFSNVTFINNNSIQNGGAIYAGASRLSINGASFTNNTTGANMSGGAIYMTGATASASIANAAFTGNTSNAYGGAISVSNSTDATPLSITNSTFSGNSTSNYGGAIALVSLANPVTISATTFDTNTVNGKGGGVYASGAPLTLSNLQFTNNTAGLEGGGLYLNGAATVVTLDASTFTGNSGTSGGGIFLGGGGSLSASGVTLSGNNTTAYSGGALYASGTTALVKTTITGNRAKQYGGGIYIPGGSLTLTNCWLTGNSADGYSYSLGGAIYDQGGTVVVYNDTIAGNYATASAGAAYFSSGDDVVTNTIAWDNTSGNNTQFGGSPTVSYSDVQGMYPLGTYPGTANVVLDPLFVNAQLASGGAPNSAGDFHLQSASPVIDKGTTTNAPADDVDGDTRPQGAGIDIGADERTATNTAPVGGYSADNLIPAAQVTQSNDGSGLITITWKGRDAESNNVTLTNFEYSVDGGATWATPANGDASGALSANWTNNGGSGYATATTFAAAVANSFAFNTKHADVAGMTGVDQSDVQVRFTLNDAIVDSASPVTSENFRVDNVAPTATITSASYDASTDTLTITGTNFTTIAAATTDISGYVDWSRFVWDVNGDDAVTANISVVASDVTSLTVTDAATLTLVFTAAKGAAIEAAVGYGDIGGADTLDVTAGFIKDAVGNAATTDSVINGALTTSALARTVCATGCTFTTIQSAIDDAGTTDGDTITVSGGPYSENINYNGKNITLLAQGVVTIQGSGADSAVVSFGNGETAGAVLDGFTIHNQGAGSATRGIHITNAAPTIRNCIVENNTLSGAVQNYPGIYITGAASGATIQNTTVRNNVAANGKAGVRFENSTGGTLTITDSIIGTGNGGGLSIENIATTTAVTRTTITGNTGARGVSARNAPIAIAASTISNNAGGGLSLDASTATLSNCTITGNTTSVGHGAGLYATGAATLGIDGCTIDGNSGGSSTGNGGGIAMDAGITATITKTTIRGNNAANGGGLFIDGASTFATIINSNITGNNAKLTTYPTGGGIYANTATVNMVNTTVAGNWSGWTAGGIGMAGGAAVTLTNGIVWGNRITTALTADQIPGTATVTYSDVEGGYTGTGNINADPLFMNLQQAGDNTPTTAGDFHLQFGSPAINAGTATGIATGAPTYDIDGDLRSGGIDIGSDEYVGVNTAPVGGYSADNILASAQISQAVDGSGIITITWKGRDTENDNVTLKGFQYSADGGATWAAPSVGDATAALSTNWANNGGTGWSTATTFAAAAVHSFTFNTKHGDVSGLNGVDQNDVRVRFKLNDGRSDSGYLTSQTFRVDDAAPTTTIASASYTAATDTLTITGANFTTIAAAGTDINAYVDWSKFLWDINGDDTTTADIGITTADVTSLTITDANTLTLMFTAAKSAVIETNTNYAAAGGADTLDVAAGFAKDTFGNAATTDAVVNGTLTTITAPIGGYTTENIIPSAQVTQATDSSGLVTISWKGRDAEANNVTLKSFEYSLNGGATWVAPANADASTALSTAWTNNGGSGYTAGTDFALATAHSFVFDTQHADVTGMSGADQSAVQVRFKLNDGVNDSGYLTSETFRVDNAIPTATIASVYYNAATDTLTVNGSNFTSIAVAGTDMKSYVDWTRIVWDINGDDAVTPNINFAAADVTSFTVVDDTRLALVFTATKATAIETTTDYGSLGGADTVDVTAGFFRDYFGNVATTDAIANAVFLTNTAPVGGYSADNIIPAAQISQATDGRGLITITWKGRDNETDYVTLTGFEYSVDGGATWAAPTNGDASTALSTNWRDNGGTGYATGTTFAAAPANSFTFDTKHADVTGLSGVDQSDVQIRFKLDDATTAGGFVTAQSFRVDDAAPTVTIISSSYGPSGNLLTILGRNFTTIANAGTDIKSYVDWSKIVWDINGNDAVTPDITIAAADVTSLTINSDMMMSLVFTDAKGAAIEATYGYGTTGGYDTLDVTAGFTKDVYGNTATTDAVANAALSTSASTRTVCASGCFFKTIQSAIDNVATLDGDTIIITDGTYDENIDFIGKNIVIESQNGAATTIIRGTGADRPVVTFGQGETAGAVLDGFTIDNLAPAGTYSRGISVTNKAAPTLKNVIVTGNNTVGYIPGAGIYINGGGAIIENSTIGGDAANKNTCQNGCGIYATTITAPLAISNSTVSENSGVEGAGIYLSNNGDQTVMLNNVAFTNNNSTQNGPGLYVGATRVSISASSFTNNVTAGAAKSGGAIYMSGATASATIDNTTFTANSTDGNGGAIYLSGSTEAAPLSITNCTFTGNSTAYYGGAIYLNNLANPATIVSSTISTNTTTSNRGGGIYAAGAPLRLTDTAVNNNIAVYEGGGLYLTGAATVVNISGGTVSGNSAWSGAGIHLLSGASLTMQGSTVSSNVATDYLGGGLNVASAAVIDKTIISGNSAAQHGGGIYAAGGSLTLTNSVISGNTADAFAYSTGAGIFDNGATISIYNSTIAGNHADASGGGLTIAGTNDVVTNSILWGNVAIANAQIEGAPTVTYSDIQGGFTGTGNLGVDPAFVNFQQATAGAPTTAGDFHIQDGSIVIDRGTAGNAPSDDIDGDVRPQGFAIDMGADEHMPSNTAPVGGYSADNVIPAAQITQATDGSGVITITWKGRDDETNNVTLKSFEYSVDGGITWSAPTNGDASAALSTNWTDNAGSGYSTAASLGAAAAHSFSFDTKHADVTGLNGVDQSDVQVRFILNDGLADSAYLISEPVRVDDLPPTATISSASYDAATDTLTITGTNFTTIAAAGTDITAYVDWNRFVWDVNGDDLVTTNIIVAASEVTSVTVTDDTTLTLVFSPIKGAAVEATSGYGSSGGADTLDVTAGFLKDIFGNAATTDAVANGTLSAFSLVITVTSSYTVISDPINGTTNPQRISGAILEFSITLTNIGDVSPDPNSVNITDVIDTTSVEYDAATGIAVVDGATASGLSMAGVGFSNTAAPGPYSYGYTPIADANGYDANVTSLQVGTTGTFAFGGSPSPSITIKYRARVK